MGSSPEPNTAIHTTVLSRPKVLNSNSRFLSPKHRILTLLNLCKTLSHLSQTLAQIHLHGLHSQTFFTTQLLLTSLSHHHFDYAHALLTNTTNSSSSSSQSQPTLYNILIRTYTNKNLPSKALCVYLDMRQKGVAPNEHTLPFVLKSCGGDVRGFGMGRLVHGDAFKYGLDCNVYVNNGLVSFYGNRKEIGNARRVFDEMPERSVVSWNSVASACVENLCLEEGIGYFYRMRDCGVEPDETTMVVVLSACVELGNLSFGKWVHSQVIERGMVLNCQLGTALVDMYAKCGSVQYANIVFNQMDEKNVWTWSAMILGLAQHGFADQALCLFSEMMRNSSVSPNYVTFVGVLCACSHAGLVDEAYQYFRDMKHVHRIEPMMIHYGAMVDVLSRAGRLKEAYDFITNMPTEPDPVLWRTLLSACNIHDVEDNSGFKDEVRKMLLKLEPKRGGNLIMAANIYAVSGMWDKATNLRRMMRNEGLKKIAGESCIDLGGSIHKFFSGYDSQADYSSIYDLLGNLKLHMKSVDDSLSLENRSCEV